MSAAEQIEAVAVAHVPIDGVMHVWARVAHHFRAFEKLADGNETLVEILNSVLDGKRQLWAAVVDGKIKASILTKIQEEKGGDRAIIEFCAGTDRDLWRDEVLAEIEEWAVYHGAREVVIYGRKGWRNEFAASGYKETHRVYRKRVDHG